MMAEAMLLKEVFGIKDVDSQVDVSNLTYGAWPGDSASIARNKESLKFSQTLLGENHLGEGVVVRIGNIQLIFLRVFTSARIAPFGKGLKVLDF